MNGVKFEKIDDLRDALAGLEELTDTNKSYLAVWGDKARSYGCHLLVDAAAPELVKLQKALYDWETYGDLVQKVLRDRGVIGPICYETSGSGRSYGRWSVENRVIAFEDEGLAFALLTPEEKDDIRLEKMEKERWSNPITLPLGQFPVFVIDEDDIPTGYDSDAFGKADLRDIAEKMAHQQSFIDAFHDALHRVLEKDYSDRVEADTPEFPSI